MLRSARLSQRERVTAWLVSVERFPRGVLSIAGAAREVLICHGYARSPLGPLARNPKASEKIDIRFLPFSPAGRDGREAPVRASSATSLWFFTEVLRWPQRFFWVSRVDNRVEDTAQILEDFVIPKPQDANTLFVKLELAI